MSKVKQLLEERGKIEHEMQRLVTQAETEKREMTAEEAQKFDELYEQDKGYAAQVERQKKLAEVSGSLDELRNHGIDRRQIVGSAAASSMEAPEQRITDEEYGLAIAAWSKRQMGVSLSARDKAACKKYRSQVNPNFSVSARHLDLNLFGNEEYRSLQRVARSGNQSQLQSRDFGTSGASSMIPSGFMRQLEIAQLAYGPMLQVAEVMTTATGNSLPWPTADDTGNTGVQLSEATTIGSSVDPTISDVTLNAYKFSSKLIKVSTEIMEDSAFDLAAFLADALGQRLGRILNTKFTVGSGDDTPNGIATASSLGVTAALATAITDEEILDLYHSVDVAYRNGAAFMAHDSTIKAIRKLKDEDGRFLWASGLQEGTPDKLLNCAVWTNNDMEALNDGDSTDSGQKVLLFGQLGKYKVRRVKTTRLMRLVERYADTDQEGFVAFIRADGDLLDAGVAPVKHLIMA